MKKRVRNILIAVVALMMAAGGIGAYIIYNIVYNRYEGETVRIYIPHDATAEAVKDTLTTHLGDYGKDVFFLWSHQKATASAAHGSYVIAPGTKALAFSRRLKFGRQTPLNLTFNNVRTVDDLASRLASKMEWSASDFITACDSVLQAKGFTPQTYAAAFLPDTYEFFWTATAEDAVKRLSDYRDKFWNDERREKAASLGLNPVKVATLASIVEEETSKSDERGKVARLYLNRLDKNMLLQADPTVKFAVGDFSLRRILNRHLAVDSPYNTYKYAGLPPGPIRIAERKTLETVLDAPRHNYLYMCAKDDFSGYHNFAVDFASHQANARRYQQALNRRGIK